MPGKAQVFELLEEMLDSGKTPEEMCRDRPELLPELRERWKEFCLIDAEVSALLPQTETTRDTGLTASPRPAAGLPRIPGYDLEAVLGSGGMGVVYKARQHALDRPVALKMLLTGSFAGPQELARFRREAEALATLRHPNIVQVYDAADVEGHRYFTMELVDGGSLAQRLSSAPQPLRHAAELVATLAGAVQFAHRSGIVHRDLKPGNILVAADGTPKITDFGLALPVDGATRFTMSGARVGTPNYMAPEQALGKASAVGPAADIYALGAVLYEMLTGRPPFVGETPLDIERQVIADEPAPPSRLNTKIPRDLETICLKCLQKNPARRYASAQDLADDLHRYLDGMPVVARPVGLAERTVKWARRRPAMATLFMAVAVLSAVIVGIGIEKAQRRGRAREAVQTELTQAIESGRAEDWRDADRILADAANYLPEANDEALRSQMDQARLDMQFAQRLEGIRECLELVNREPFFLVTASHGGRAERYERAFKEANFDLAGDPSVIRARILANPLSEQTITAIDEWALSAFMLKREPLQRRLLQIARTADPDPTWRDRFRNADLWRDKAALLALANDTDQVSKRPAAHQLAIWGILLRNVGEGTEETRLLRAALDRHPGDFWLNWELAEALGRINQHAESAKYWRVVNALRPGTVEIAVRLGAELSLAGEYNEAIPLFEKATRLRPTDGGLRHNLVRALMRAGRTREVEAVCRQAIADNPGDSYGYHALAMFLWEQRRGDEAIRMFRKAIDLKPGDAGAHGNLGTALLSCGRLEEAIAVFQETIRLKPSHRAAHRGLGRALAKVGRYQEAAPEFRWVIRELGPKQGYSDGEGGLDPEYYDAHADLLNALLCLGRLEEGRSVAQVAAKRQTILERPEAILRQLEICQLLAPLELEATTVVGGAIIPSNDATQRALAEWLYLYRRRTVASARIYDSEFARTPAIADDIDAKDRYYAACAAAMAGCGLGDGAAELDDQAKGALRAKALQWLTADLETWKKRYQGGRGMAQSKAAQTAAGWCRCADLDCVRTQAALARLPAGEREAWQKLWKQVNSLASHAPQFPLERARGYASRRQWTHAAAIYPEVVWDGPGVDGEVCFERAAVQLLSGDLPAYRQSCEEMLIAAQHRQVRPFLAGRASTLAPHSVADSALLAMVSEAELHAFPNAFWSLTEQGALAYRSQRYGEAVRLFERSLIAQPEPGCAVLNWLWLALAYQRLGDPEQARIHLNKAVTWLDSLGPRMPKNAEMLHLHLHNWLEAHVLRREAEQIVSPSHDKE